MNLFSPTRVFRPLPASEDLKERFALLRDRFNSSHFIERIELRLSSLNSTPDWLRRGLRLASCIVTLTRPCKVNLDHHLVLHAVCLLDLLRAAGAHRRLPSHMGGKLPRGDSDRTKTSRKLGGDHVHSECPLYLRDSPSIRELDVSPMACYALRWSRLRSSARCQRCQYIA